MQTYLSVSVRRLGNAAVVEVGGELDLASASQLEQALKLAWRDQPQEVVVDLRQLSFIDMAGLRVLLEAQQQADEQDRKLVLAHVHKSIRRVLDLARVAGAFTIQDGS